MTNRIAIAVRVSLVTMMCAGAAMIAGVIIFAVGTGFSNPKPMLSYVTLIVLPFLATAVPTKLMSGYVSRASNGAFHAGPMVLGAAAGSFVGLFMGLNLSGSV